MADYVTDSWKIRIDASRDAQRRSRYVFAILTVTCVAFLVSIWNSIFSWAEHHASTIVRAEQITKGLVEHDGGLSERGKLESDQIGEYQKALIDQRIRDWVSSERIDVPLLGVSISGADIPILGALSLLVITLWFYFCVRRENHLIGQMLLEAHQNELDGSDELRTMVFHGIASHVVFTSLTDDDEVRYTLEPVRPKPWNVGRALVHRLVWILFYLPCLTMLGALLGDIWSLWRAPLFRFQKHDSRLVDAFSVSDLRHLVVEYVPTLLLTFILLLLCNRIWELHRGTRSLLVEFRDKHMRNGRA